jgi:nitrate reductase (NAD(P)H)
MRIETKHADLHRAHDGEQLLLAKNNVSSEIDSRDIGTPDDWVPRNPNLIRLTGKHPFNAEPPSSILLDQGFITPTSLHFVRNHGAVPRLTWDSHKIMFDGLLKNPQEITMSQLCAMESFTVPVSVVCSGNRRKELNQIKNTSGFNYGNSGHSCSLWTGVRLSSILNLCNVDLSKARHVQFLSVVGAENLPAGGYGTSIPIYQAMDAASDVMIAFEQNGDKISPDHGFPVRMIIPGLVGGRMVKWLGRVTVSDTASQNHYHFYDNRILPPHVDAALAEKEKWWYRPEYIFNEFSINSAITYPMHAEQVLLDEGTYTIKGFAYSGGGRKITRVEVSLDGGTNWKLCEVDRPEERVSKAPLNGRYWCWSLWTLAVSNLDLLMAATGAGEICCRAWDSSNNTQPDKPTWNLMGHGNNCHFRVKVQPCMDGGPHKLQFLHPTLPGSLEGGWMLKPKLPSPSLAAPGKANENPRTADSNVETYSTAEVASHNSERSSWLVIQNRVYDATSYLKEHPGGSASIVASSGCDSTDEFLGIHSDQAKEKLEEFYIGNLQEAGTKSSPGAKEQPKGLPHSQSLKSVTITEAPRLGDTPEDGVVSEKKTQENSRRRHRLLSSIKSFIMLAPKARSPVPLVITDVLPTSSIPELQQHTWTGFKLVARKEISRNGRVLTFALPTPAHRLNLPIGHHMLVKAVVDGRVCVRAYTPISSAQDQGTFELCIKVYFRGVAPQFPLGGSMSQHMEAMKIGDDLAFKWPFGHLEYKGRGVINCSGSCTVVRQLGFICGGTGIAPAFQIMRAISEDPEDTTEIFLLYSNHTKEDILMREELDEMSKVRQRTHVRYTISSRPDSDWKHSVGRIDESMVRNFIPKPCDTSFVGLCGPPAMLKNACVPILTRIGYSEDNFTAF